MIARIGGMHLFLGMEWELPDEGETPDLPLVMGGGLLISMYLCSPSRESSLSFLWI